MPVCVRVLGGSRSSAVATRDASACQCDGVGMKPRQPRHAGRGRLTRSAEFERVYRQGRSCANRYLVLYTFPNQSVAEPRIGLSVSRRVGGAVQRNRVKRVLREAVATKREGFGARCDVVVVARPEVLGLIEAEGLAGVSGALAELIAKARGEQRDARRRAA